MHARWSRNGQEIYYRSDRRIVAVPFSAAGWEPAFGKPTPLFADDYDFGQGISIANYDVTPEGRFIMLRRGANGGKLRAVVNWTEEMSRVGWDQVISFFRLKAEAHGCLSPDP